MTLRMIHRGFYVDVRASHPHVVSLIISLLCPPSSASKPQISGRPYLCIEHFRIQFYITIAHHSPVEEVYQATSGKGGSEERAEAKGKGESLQLKRGQREREIVRASEEGPEELNVL